MHLHTMTKELVLVFRVVRHLQRARAHVASFLFFFFFFSFIFDLFVISLMSFSRTNKFKLSYSRSANVTSVHMHKIRALLLASCTCIFVHLIKSSRRRMYNVCNPKKFGRDIEHVKAKMFIAFPPPTRAPALSNNTQ